MSEPKITITLYKAGWCGYCKRFEPFWKQLKSLLDDEQLKKIVTVDEYIHEIETAIPYDSSDDISDDKSDLNNIIKVLKVKDESINYEGIDKDQEKKYRERYKELAGKYKDFVSGTGEYENKNKNKNKLKLPTYQDIVRNAKNDKETINKAIIKVISAMGKKGINGFPTILVEIKDGKSFYYEGNRESITDLVKGIFEDESIKIGDQSIKAYLDKKINPGAKNGMTGGFFDYSKHKKLKYHREYMKCRNLYLKLKNK